MNLPNYITLLRILLVPFFFSSLISYTPEQPQYRFFALYLFTFAAITDALDGFIARVTHSRTRLGKFLDPLADKLLILSGFLGLLFVNLPFEPPAWITVTIVFRDLVIVVGLVIIFLMTGNLKIEPNFLGKCTTASQMITLISLLLSWQIAIIFCYITVLLTILSCLFYVFRDFSELTKQS